ncbi:MAG: hypothetical protein JWR27_1573, partial [Aeromicrobium sp.]|nr:hypothetical protein [Aeromicrobium sp.]
MLRRMTIDPQQIDAEQIDGDLRLPSRFRAQQARGASIGRVLKAVARVKEVDEDLMDLIGRRLM